MVSISAAGCDAVKLLVPGQLSSRHVEEATNAPEVPKSWCDPLQRMLHPVAQPWSH